MQKIVLTGTYRIGGLFMKTWFKKNVVFIALILVGVIAALVILIGRASVENDNRTYDILLDYSDVKKMAAQSEYDVDHWLDYFAEKGIDNIGVTETNVKALAEDTGYDVYVLTLSKIRSEYGWEKKYPAEVSELISKAKYKDDALVICTDMELFDTIVDAYEKRADNISYDIVRENGTGFMWITRTFDKNGTALTGSKWTEMCFGFEPGVIEMIQKHGYTIMPRTTTVDGLNSEKYARAVYSDFVQYKSPYFINSGDSLIGYDNEDKAAAQALLLEYLDEAGSSIALVEKADQSKNGTWDGLEDLVRATGYDTVRCFSMWPFVQSSYAKYNYTGPEEVVNILYRAVYERNCHLIYMKMMLNPDNTNNYITDPEAYDQLVDGLLDRMESLGYTYTGLEAAEVYSPSLILRILVGIGAIAACIVVLELILPIPAKFRYILLAIGIIGVCGAFYAAPNASKFLLSVGGGIIMPCLAAVGLNRYTRYTEERFGNQRFLPLILSAVGLVFCLTVISLCSSFFTSSALSETEFMIEMQLYLGVKFMQLVPLGVFLFSYFQIYVWERYVGKVSSFDRALRKEERTERNSVLSGIMDKTVKVSGVGIALIALVILAGLVLIGSYYLSRTGNTDEVSVTEIEFRNFLENTFTVRPRSKEFLIGYPCMMLFIWCRRRNIKILPAIFGCGAVVGGYVSIVNTFLHIRTPFVLSLLRILLGFVPGIVIGIAAMAVAELIYRLITNLRKKKVND